MKGVKEFVYENMERNKRKDDQRNHITMPSEGLELEVVPRTMDTNSGYSSEAEKEPLQNPLQQSKAPKALGKYTPHEALPEPTDRRSQCVKRVQERVQKFWDKYKEFARKTFWVLMLIAYLVYLGFAIHTSLVGAAFLITLTSFVAFIYFYNYIIAPKCQRRQIASRLWEATSGRTHSILKWLVLTFIHFVNSVRVCYTYSNWVVNIRLYSSKLSGSNSTIGLGLRSSW